MKTLIKILIIFLAIIGAMTIIFSFLPLNIEFGTVDFWSRHGLFFLIFIAIFPRLTLFFSSVPFGGLFWWLGFIFAPRLLISILATIAYWNTNPLLVIISWVFTLGGESGEKTVVYKKTYHRRKMRNITPH